MEEIGSLFLVLALALAVALFVARPFLRKLSGLPAAEWGEEGKEKEQEHLRSALLAEQDRVLTALQELDFDSGMGKVPEEEYPTQRAALLRRGADVLRRLDALNQGVLPAGDSVESRIEAAVAARRADAVRTQQKDAAGEAQPDGAVRNEEKQYAISEPVHMAASGNHGGNGRNKQKDELEEIIASRKRSRQESSAGFCPHCGRPVSKSDKFCSRCGTAL